MEDEARSHAQILGKKKIKELLQQVDPSERVEPEVEQILLEMADEFIDNVTRLGCQLARHRQSDTLEVKDLQMVLARHRQSDTLEVKDLQMVLESSYDIKIPGFANEELRQVKKAAGSNNAYQQKLGAVKKAIAAEQADREKEKVLKRGR
ncbi:hypothetical protein MP638_002752 [Amoeboaphelidium occidentale]|nr:hypothetical protein MP638_002752 [Amoeboaphelidium occidentale]